MYQIRLKYISILFFVFALNCLKAQEVLTIGDDDDSDVPGLTKAEEFEIAEITVEGADHFDKNVIKLLSGLTEGDKVQVPGEKFATAINNLWKQGLFEDIKIIETKRQGKFISISIQLVERPRMSKFQLKGVTKSEADDLREKIQFMRGKVVTDAMLANTKQTIKEFFINKAYLDADVDIVVQKDEKLENGVILFFDIKKGYKVRIKDINIYGNNNIKKWKLRRKFKETKRRRWWNPFNDGKFEESNYEKDLKAVIAKYNSKGYRDMRIAKDTMYRITKTKRKINWKKSWDNFSLVKDTIIKSKRLSIDLHIEEGNKYYFRNVTWVGNSKYSTKDLNNTLNIKKGDVYDQEYLESRLYMNPNGFDVSSMYMDEGYLFFNVTPVETMVNGDSIDLEMRIFEGKQATINRVTVVGNSKTNDRVVLREIRTRPGQLFRRSDVIRTQRELAQLGYFDQEKLGVQPTPNPANGTVDIEYTVEEKPSDQIELSGGYGGGRVVGTLGVSFTNFSIQNFFKKESWRPLPSGDGQRLSVRAQTNGLYYQSYNFSFTEPWLGGKKPNSFSIGAYYSVQSNGEKQKIKVNGEKISNPRRQSLNITGFSLGLGKRLKWPDDFFTIYHELNYQYYVLNNYGSIFSFSQGYSNNIYYRAVLQRSNVDKPIFETKGSQITLSGQWTPPYSLFNGKDYTSSAMTDQERYKFVEYHKYKFTVTNFTPITNKRGTDGKEARNLILRTSAGFGFIASYDNRVGQPPFERFYLGGSGLTGFSLNNREIIALRGYDDQSLSAGVGSLYITKYTAELRFPITTNPSATIFVLGFVEAGNSWSKAKDFNPFKVYRSTGVGVRVFLPMFGLLGFDYGWRLDNVPSNPSMQKGQFHFTIGAQLGEL